MQLTACGRRIKASVARGNQSRFRHRLDSRFGEVDLQQVKKDRIATGDHISFDDLCGSVDLRVRKASGRNNEVRFVYDRLSDSPRSVCSDEPNPRGSGGEFEQRFENIRRSGTLL